MDPKSLAAARVLAEATEKQNRPETVSWRSLIARLDPVLDNQLNLASASLRFGQLDLARRALDRVKAEERKKASYQVVAGWLARAEGNPIEEERHFAAAVAQDPANDVYRFNLAALQIHSPDPEKNAAARNQLERLSKVSHFRTDA
jgi:predicted Zn-dependent protease